MSMTHLCQHSKQNGQNHNLAYVSVAQASRILCISEKQVRRLIGRGELKARRISQRAIRINVRDLERVGKPVTSLSEVDA